MSQISRRSLLQLGAGAGAGAAASVLTPSIARAAAIPADRRTGSIRDVEHVVVLMQEKRGFDHYFGARRGVRGYGDTHPVTLPSGRNVFHQPNGSGEVLPFRADTRDAGLAFLDDLDHSWNRGHDVLDNGLYDRWIPNKSPATMVYLTREDIPFHYALADAFTVCDDYHCSLIGPTDPNRYSLWTGGTGNDGTGGGAGVAREVDGLLGAREPERAPGRGRAGERGQGGDRVKAGR